MVHFFKKELASNSFIVNGAPVPFELLGNNRGVIALSDAEKTNQALIQALNTAAATGRGGISKISEAEALLLKKANPRSLTTSNKRLPFGEPLRVMPQQPSPFRPKGDQGAAPAATNPAAPPPPPPNPRDQHLAEKARARRQNKPSTGRASRAKAQPSPQPQPQPELPVTT